MSRDAVEDRTHGVLADPEANVAPRANPRLEVVVPSLQVTDVVQRRSYRSALHDEQRNLRGDRLGSCAAFRVAMALVAGNSGIAARSAAASGVLRAVSSATVCAYARDEPSSSASFGFAAFHASKVLPHDS